MFHKVAVVARHNGIPVADLVDFALSRDTTYDVTVKDGDAIINERAIEHLVLDFRALVNEEVEREIEYLLNQYPYLAHSAGFDVGCEFDPKLG